MITENYIIYCNKCNRPIPEGKNYLDIGGWKICGICQWEESQKNISTDKFDLPLINHFIDAENNVYEIDKANCVIDHRGIIIFYLKEKIGDEKTVRLLSPVFK